MYDSMKYELYQMRMCTNTNVSLTQTPIEIGVWVRFTVPAHIYDGLHDVIGRDDHPLRMLECQETFLIYYIMIHVVH